MKNKIKAWLVGACLAVSGMSLAHAEDSFYNPAGEDGSCGSSLHYHFTGAQDWYMWEIPAIANGATYHALAWYFEGYQNRGYGYWPLALTCVDGTIYGGSGSGMWGVGY